MKPEMLLDEAQIGSTLVVYGSARIPAPEEGSSRGAAATRSIASRQAIGGQCEIL